MKVIEIDTGLLFVSQQIVEEFQQNKSFNQLDLQNSKRNVLILGILLNYSRSIKPSDQETEMNVDPSHPIGLLNIDKTWETVWTIVIYN
jgi:hypothetical protein